MTEPAGNDRSPESFNEFKDSFFYGSRSNLEFKFLAELSEPEAGEFFAGLLAELSMTMNDGDATRLVDHVRRWQQRAYTSRLGAKSAYQYDDVPFTVLVRPKPKHASASSLGPNRHCRPSRSIRRPIGSMCATVATRPSRPNSTIMSYSRLPLYAISPRRGLSVRLLHGRTPSSVPRRNSGFVTESHPYGRRCSKPMRSMRSYLYPFDLYVTCPWGMYSECLKRPESRPSGFTSAHSSTWRAEWE